MFSLFSHSTPVVYGFEARARLAQPEGYQGREKWILLSPYEFFPQAGGEPNRRLNLHSFARHTPEERARRYAVYQEMVARMKVLHERRFDESIDRIQLYYLEWPKSSDGYFAHVAEATKLLIIIDE